MNNSKDETPHSIANVSATSYQSGHFRGNMFEKKKYYKRWWKRVGYVEPSRNRFISLKEISMIASLVSEPTSAILDVGCGTGTILQILASVGHKNLIGTDLENTFSKDGKSSFVVSETTHLPIRSELFDVVIGKKFVSKRDVAESLEEFSRILREEGTIVIEVPNVNRFRSRMYRLLGLTPKYPVRYFPHLHKASFEGLLAECGLAVSSIRGDYVDVPLLGGPLSRLGHNYLPRLFGRIKPDLCLHLLAVCRKPKSEERKRA